MTFKDTIKAHLELKERNRWIEDTLPLSRYRTEDSPVHTARGRSRPLSHPRRHPRPRWAGRVADRGRARSRGARRPLVGELVFDWATHRVRRSSISVDRV